MKRETICCKFCLVILFMFAVLPDVVAQRKNVGSQQTKQAKTIYIYTYGDFPQAIADNAITDLKKVYPADKIVVKGKMEIPKSAIYKSEKVGYTRLWASTLLKHQMKLHEENCIVLAFTTMDIAADVQHKDKIDKDWGIFGLGSQYWHSCVCSLYRMQKKGDKVANFSKLVQHELGHCFGLPHCTNSTTCIISDAEKKYRFPKLNGYCTECKRKLNALGWNFKVGSINSPN